MKVVEGKGMPLGRLASYVAKEALKGEEVAVVNCGRVIITGNSKSIEGDFQIKRSRIGSSQKGPKHPATNEKIVKRAIRGMLPNHREGRGREAFKRVKCYSKIPENLKSEKLFVLESPKKIKFTQVQDLTKKK